MDEGYLDTYEGFWEEDEEDGAEGFLELDENTFWKFDDDSAAWFQRRFQGRKIQTFVPSSTPIPPEFLDSRRKTILGSRTARRRGRKMIGR